MVGMGPTVAAEGGGGGGGGAAAAGASAAGVGAAAALGAPAEESMKTQNKVQPSPGKGYRIFRYLIFFVADPYLSVNMLNLTRR